MTIYLEVPPLITDSRSGPRGTDSLLSGRNGPDAWPTGEAMSQSGVGATICHHGEILQGVFEDDNRRLHRALVTLPCPLIIATATFCADASGTLRVVPKWKTKAARAAELTSQLLGIPSFGGTLSVPSAVRPRLGLGSSSGDVVAAIRAVAAAYNATLPPEDVARIAVASEVASDSVMFSPSLVLFAHREGRVLERFPHPLPPLLVLGVNCDPFGQGVDTVAFRPARYDCREIETFACLRAALRRALRTRDTGLLGRIATSSATINQRFLPTAHFQALLDTAEVTGAVGVQVSHSGTVAGLLYDPERPGLGDQIDAARDHLARIGLADARMFRADDDGEGKHADDDL